MRIVSIIMAVVFVGFTLVQFNDIDAWWWIGTYTVCAVLSVWAALRPPPRWLTMTLAVAFTAWAIWLVPETTGAWWAGEVEREIGGLAICAAWNLVLYRWSASRS